MNLDIDILEEPPAVEAEAFAEADLARLADLVEHVGAQMHLDSEVEVSLAVVDAAEMERLHLEWMDLPGPTDVMSFPMDQLRPGTPEQPVEGVLGDIVLCPVVARDQARAAGHSTSDELCLLTVHGMLHCLGYDHAEPEEEREMFALQRTLLEEFLGRPAPVETRH